MRSTKKDREEQEMSNTLDSATSRAGDQRVESAAQSIAIDNRAQIAREIKAAKDPKKLEGLVFQYITLEMTSDVSTPDRLRSIEKELIALRPGDRGFAQLVKNVIKEQGEGLTGLWQEQLLNKFRTDGPANAGSPQEAAKRLRRWIEG